MKKSVITSTKTLLLACLVLFSLQSQAQKKEQKKPTEWPEEGKFRIDTIYNKKLPYNLFINAGLQVEGDLFGKSPAGVGVYVYGRYTLARLIQISGTIVTGAAPLANQIGGNVAANYDYHNYSARIAIPLKKSKEPVNVSKKLMQYQYREGGQQYQKTYTANFPVMASTYQGLTGSISQLHRYFGQKYTSGASFNMFDANNDTFHQQAIIGYSTLMFSVGFHYSQGIKFKGKAYATLEGRHRRKTVRQKSVLDMCAELLIGATKADEKVTGIMKDGKFNYDAPYVDLYKRGDVKTNKFGFRFEINMKRGLMGMRLEMGTKPGIRHDYSEDGGKVENEWLVKRMANAYMVLGIGLGIGAL